MAGRASGLARRLHQLHQRGPLVIFFGSAIVGLILLGGLIFAVVAGVRALAGRANAVDAEQFDLVEAAKSFAIHGGLFLALIACAVGLIDLLQSFVESGRFAGSDSDLARGLSLLIVGMPVFGLLLRGIAARDRERAGAGATEAHLGWSIYLVAALSTTLIATLTSYGQIMWDLTHHDESFEAAELMQLMAWAALWLLHWFVLRPRFGVLADMHLAIGSITGLGWMLTGVGAVVFRILIEAYTVTFDDTLGDDIDVGYWLGVAVAGAVVWVWHWLLHFNRPSSVEGDRRKSPLWYLTVVVAGVLPGLTAVVVSVTTMVSGLLIWFIGSTDEDAAAFFEPSTIMFTLLLLGLASWAYHRWELERDGMPVRNESLRFHDYVVAAAALVGVVGAIAVLIGLLVEAISARNSFAGGLHFDNVLIVTITVLAAAAAVWWTQWIHIEYHRARHPRDESDSLWRKLYLIAAFGVGGLVLAGSLIWILFVFLRDLLDGALGGDTVNDLTGPVGWAVAVVGAVWYHVGIWRVDRATLAGPTRVAAPSTAVAAAAPKRPSPASSSTAAITGADAAITLRAATAADHGEIFTLQRAAFVDEAVHYETLDVPTLKETFAELRERLRLSSTLLAIDGDRGRIIGSVSVRRWREGGLDIERLMVAPDRRRTGVASLLLDELERSMALQGETELQLIVGERVAEARELYERRGYAVAAREHAPDGPALLTLRKKLAR